MPTDPLVVATRCYYWKPMAALFRSLELLMYRKLCITLQGPVLDLGCGDGKVVSMLKEIGRVTDPVWGIDISAMELSKGRKTNAHSGLLQGSGNTLPFKDESFSSIFSHGVLSAIPEGVEKALQEAHRVLKKDGVFIVTVPSDKFMNVLLVPKIIGQISLKAKDSYLRRFRLRSQALSAYESQEWNRQFEVHGFEVVTLREFFSSRSGHLWSLFSMQLMRICGLLKFVRNKHVVNIMSRFLRIVCAKSYSNDHVDPKADFGYLFIVAKKGEVKLEDLL